jgi:hypothetical protein
VITIFFFSGWSVKKKRLSSPTTSTINPRIMKMYPWLD